MPHKIPSTGIEQRNCTLAIKLTGSEKQRAEELAAQHDLSMSAYFGLLIIQHLENEELLPAGYYTALTGNHKT